MACFFFNHKDSTMFRNRERASQLISFEGMKYGLCSPTDIDLTLDFKGKTFVYAELKFKHTPLTQGQRIYISNVVKSHFAAGNHAVGIVAWHEEHDPDYDVQAKEAKVIEAIGQDGRWVRLSSQNFTLDEYIKKVYNYHLERNNLQY